MNRIRSLTRKALDGLYRTLEELKLTCFHVITKFPTSGLYRTLEELKCKASKKTSYSPLVCTVPWRNWNSFMIWCAFSLMMVCTVPWRNWNSVRWQENNCRPCVCTVPWRNWNTRFRDAVPSKIHRFVPYLGGIEIESICQRRMIIKKVCTVPWRNWNISYPTVWNC